ncbi:hypothetical protein [Fodinicola acaciae]|uniref:hypothetical protein n=1 Tax=Fodinicola acaciae TaxID=2681555 RepID=UPI0013D07C6C|nr:hypothetical protein [Fodinicola acaciae]
MEQDDVRAGFESLGQQAWSTVYDSWYESGVGNRSIYTVFADPSRREAAMAEPTWDVSIGDYRPGFVQHYTAGERTTEYDAGGEEDGFRPLVLRRNFDGIVPSTLEIIEEFRLFHNLYWDAASQQFLKLATGGTLDAAIKMSDDRVEVRTSLLRQFQAARQLDFYFLIASVHLGAEGMQPPDQITWRTEVLHVERQSSRDGFMVGGQPYTRYVGKKVLPAPPVEKSGIWPYEEPDNYFPDFIIDVDEDGQNVRHTCNPDALANNFGSNPDAPHYLTPVHFRKDVLQKYYEQPELYTVEDGLLRCAGLWHVEIDNSAEESVVVFLGDLGRDLPKVERDYWRSYNIAPSSPVSETLIRRAFLAQFVEPIADDLRVRSAYIALAKAWRERYGWDLYKEPEAADAGLLQRLRIPLNESQTEFEGSILIMTLLMVDALNETQIKKLLTERRDNERGISKLERWLKQEGYPHVDRDIPFLRSLQEVRSKIAAHRKGSDYEQVLTRNFGQLRGSAAVKILFGAALTMLTSLREWVTTADEGREEPADD